MTVLEWPSPGQAAAKLGVTPTRLRQLLDQGRIGYARTALGRLVNPDDVARLAEERRARRPGTTLPAGPTCSPTRILWWGPRDS